MESYLYQELYLKEKDYWWSKARRRMVLRFLKKFAPEARKILDVGCGTGAFLENLDKNGYQFQGIDSFKEAVDFCQKRGLKGVRRASATTLPFPNEAFDVITGLDVLEHIKDEGKALKEIHRVLKKEGLLILTVPANPKLWSERDFRLKHFRRYTREELETKLKAAGFRPFKLSYTTLIVYFPLWLATRRKASKTSSIKTDLATLPFLLNTLFYWWLNFETWLLERMDFSFGSSLLVVATKWPL